MKPVCFLRAGRGANKNSYSKHLNTYAMLYWMLRDNKRLNLSSIYDKLSGFF